MTAWLEKPTTVSDRATALMETIQQEKEDWDGLFCKSIQIMPSISVLDWPYRNSKSDARRKISKKNYVGDHEAMAVDKICHNKSCWWNKNLFHVICMIWEWDRKIRRRSVPVYSYSNSASTDIRIPSTDFTRPLVKTYVTEKYQNGDNRIIWVSILKIRHNALAVCCRWSPAKEKSPEKLLKFQTKHPQNAAEQKFLLKSRTLQCHGCQSSIQKQIYESACVAKLYIAAMTIKLCLVSQSLREAAV